MSTDESLDVIKKKVSDKKRLSELINQNNILVNDLINKAKNNNGNKVDESTKVNDVVKPDSNKIDDKVDNKSTDVVKPNDNDIESNKPTDVVKPDSNKKDTDVVKPTDSNKVDNKPTDVVKPKPTDKVDNGTKVNDKVDNGTKVNDKVDNSTKDTDVVKPTDSNKVDNKLTDKIDNTKVDVKIKKVPLVLKDIIISETPVIRLNEKFDFTIKYDEQMLDIDENVQKINSYNNIHVNTKRDDENINFILNYLSKFKK